MRALVTGGTGFVGANLVAALNDRGVEALVLHRESSSKRALEGLVYESVIGNILDEPEALARSMEGCDWVFHVAAVADYWRQGREWLYKVNVEGTRRVLQAAKLAGVRRLVFTSSLAAMGMPQEGELLTEEDEFNLRPEQFPYGHSKYLAEQEVQRAVEQGLKAVIVNPSIVLGARDLNQISGSIVVEVARGLVRFLPPGGANYVAVEDVAAGHIAAAEKGRAGERYILGGENLPSAEMVALVAEVVGRPAPRLRLPAWVLPPAAWAVRGARAVLGNRVPLDENQVRLLSRYIYADNRKAVQELDLPQTPVRTAVQRAYNWYNRNGVLG